MTQADLAIEGAELVELLDHQRTLYRRLRLLADRQKTLVMMDDAQPLLALLGERQRLVDGLVAISGRMSPYRTRWTAIYAALDDATRRRVADLLEEVNASLATVLQRDRHDTMLLDARRQDTAIRLRAMDSGARANTAYAAAGAALVGAATDARG